MLDPVESVGWQEEALGQLEEVQEELEAVLGQLEEVQEELEAVLGQLEEVQEELEVGLEELEEVPEEQVWFLGLVELINLEKVSCYHVWVFILDLHTNITMTLRFLIIHRRLRCWRSWSFTRWRYAPLPVQSER